MRIYQIAQPEDLLKVNLVRLRGSLREAAARYEKMADRRIDPAFIDAVLAACATSVDNPAVRAWSHTISQLQGFGDGGDPVPHSSAVGHLEADSPRAARLLELLAWEISAEELSSKGAFTLTLPAAPPTTLAVGNRGSIVRESIWPTAGVWTLQRRAHAISLHREQQNCAADTVRFVPPLVLQGVGIDAVVALHQPSLTNRDFQDFPIVRSRAFGEEWGARVVTAAEAVARYSIPAGTVVRTLVRAVLPLVCGEQAIGSASRESALGLVFLPSTGDIDQLAECVLHEAMHQLLFRIEECGGLFTNDTRGDEAFYSPWRTDPRPLRMTLHGAFVFTAVADLYLCDLAPSLLGVDAAECHHRAYHRAEQVRVALDVVRRHATLTRFGEVVASAISLDLESICRRVEPAVADRRQVDTQIERHREKHGHYLR